MSSAHYRGRATTNGNSTAIRLDAALFRTHPEFRKAEVHADVIAPGVMVIATTQAVGDDEDPMMETFLHFLETQMTAHPEQIAPLDAALMEEIAELVDGVEPDGE